MAPSGVGYASRMAYQLPDLPYDVGALAPLVSAELLELHHTKHHAAYVDGANATLDELAIVSPDDAERQRALHHSLAFNLGGHQLHSLFWVSMRPGGPSRPEGELSAAIDDAFGSFDALTTRIATLMTGVQGVGWAVVSWDPVGRRLVTFQVQDHQGSQVMGTIPLLAADAWEHAYYLDYKNDKARWAEAFLQLADWHAASQRFDEALASHRVAGRPG